jgi:hypothetical protein
MSKSKQRGFSAVELGVVALMLLGFGGWIANVVKLIYMLDGSITAMFIARVVGVFAAPLGAVLGFF